MDDRDRLALYPFVVVRIACRVCSRAGAYRLARLAAKFGPEIGLRDLLDRFSYDCLWRAEAHGKRGVSACGVYLPDLDRDRSKCLIRPRTGLQIARHGAGSWQVLASDRATTPVAISLTPGVYASSCFVTIGTYPASRPLGGVTMSFGSTFTKFMTLGGFAM